MKVRAEKIEGLKLNGEQLLQIRFEVDSRVKIEDGDLVIRQSRTGITLPIKNFSEELMLKTLKERWRTSEKTRKVVKKISEKILGKEYDI